MAAGFLLRAIADFDRLRPGLLEAVERRPGIPLDRVRLQLPVVFPSKVIAAPVNYRPRIEEMRPLVQAELHAIERYGVFLTVRRRSWARRRPSSCRSRLAAPTTGWSWAS